MALWLEVLVALLGGSLLWLAGAVFFDAVHWLLHVMLRSRFRLLRALAWPHAVHHAWIGPDLQVRFELQRRNVACHIVPEFLTQLAFSAVLALVLPWSVIAVLVALQLAVFAYILSCRGLDPNHRPIERLDAHAPGFQPLPAYHAIHHVHRDAHYSSYTKLVDWVVGGGIPLEGRRFLLRGRAGELGSALAQGLRAGGASEVIPIGDVEPGSAGVIVLLDPREDPEPIVESLAYATRDDPLPPEVWCVRTRPDAKARHYQRDVRVQLRVLMAPGAEAMTIDEAHKAVRRGLFWIRRGLHFVPMEPWPAGLRSYLAFRRTRPVVPAETPRIRHRAELASLSPSL